MRGRAASECERGRPVSNHVSSLEEAVIGLLCGGLRGGADVERRVCGMRRLAAYALNMAAGRFEKFARTTGFMRRGEALSILMDDDRLVARARPRCGRQWWNGRGIQWVR